MLTDPELWACASRYIASHGVDAPIIAAMRADEFLAEGDMEGMRTFQSIVRRINELLDGSAKVHH